jgi:multiple sugar transport system ATP-binding protein
LTFEVTVDMVESLGADKYVHFKIEGAGAQAAQLAELAAESGAAENEFVARVSTESQAKTGEKIELAFDTSKIVIFDAESGKNLTLPSADADQPSAPSEPPPASEPAASESTPPPAESTPPSE